MRQSAALGFWVIIPVILGTTLVLFCVGADYTLSQTRQDKGLKMEKDILFEIKLSSDKGPTLRAVLVNHSQVSQTILHHHLLQPSRLDLVGQRNMRIEPFDSRSIKKYDATIYCGYFKSLAPGKEIELGSIRFKRAGQIFTANWGPYEFEELIAGTYTARVIWESAANTCVDEDTGQLRRLPTVWQGQLISNEVNLQLR